MRKRFIATIIFILIFPGCRQPAGSPRGEASHGQLPFWYQLTELESGTIRAVRATPGPESLLLLAIVMGGEIRTVAEARQGLETFRGFVQRMEPVVAAERDPWQRAHRLFREFHAAFLEGPDSDRELSRYEADQTRVDVLLATGRYNCLSSAILFGLIAEAFGFEAKGVVLSSHALVQLERAGWDQTIEVETTSRTGFDWVHDREFYARQASAWSRQRGLGSTTYEDYLERRIVPLSELVLELSRVQHVARLGAEDRGRLIEIAGFLGRSDRFQLARLSQWSRSFNELQKRGEHGEIRRRFERIAPELSRLVQSGDEAFRVPLAWQSIHWAVADAFAGDTEPAFRHAAFAVRSLRQTDEDYPKIVDNLGFVANQLIRGFLEQKRFVEAEKAFGLFAELTPDAAGREELRSVLYNAVGGHYFEREAWEKAVVAFARCGDAAGGPCANNLEAAYLNWSGSFSREGDWPRAAEVLERCVAARPRSEPCQERLAEIRAQHRGAR